MPRVLLLLCLPALALTACERMDSAEADTSATTDDRSGTVQAFIQDGSAADAGSRAVRADAASSESKSASLRGSFHGNFVVALFSEEGGYWVDIGRRAEMKMDLQNPRPAALVESVGDVPPGTYNRIRVLVCHSSVQLEPGSRVGARTVDAPSSVHLTETGDVVVERKVEPFRVSSDSRIELDIDLNSERWLTEQAVASDTASIPAFVREVAVSVRKALK